MDIEITPTIINSSPPSVAYKRQWTGSALVQIMACRLFGAKPLSKPMLGYCQLDRQEQTSVKLESEFYHFHSTKCIWKCRLPELRPFCPGGDELSHPAFRRCVLASWAPEVGQAELSLISFCLPDQTPEDKLREKYSGYQVIHTNTSVTCSPKVQMKLT